MGSASQADEPAVRPAAVVCAVILASALPAWASGLDIEVDATVRAAHEAGSRADFDPAMHLESCRGSTCRWSIGDAVEITATSYGGRYLDQIEANWNNSDASTNALSLATYQHACALVIAMTRPLLSPHEVLLLASKIALTKPSRKEQVDVEVVSKPVRFYGSRSRPSQPSFPNEAFVQCGATLDPG